MIILTPVIRYIKIIKQMLLRSKFDIIQVDRGEHLVKNDDAIKLDLKPFDLTC